MIDKLQEIIAKRPGYRAFENFLSNTAFIDSIAKALITNPPTIDIINADIICKNAYEFAFEAFKARNNFFKI